MHMPHPLRGLFPLLVCTLVCAAEAWFVQYAAFAASPEAAWKIISIRRLLFTNALLALAVLCLPRFISRIAVLLQCLTGIFCLSFIEAMRIPPTVEILRNGTSLFFEMGGSAFSYAVSSSKCNTQSLGIGVF